MAEATPSIAPSAPVVVQRKALEGTSPSLMPLVAPVANDVPTPGTNQSPGADKPVAKSVVGDRLINREMLPVVTASPIKWSLEPESNQIMPLADRADSGGADEMNPTREAGVSVVTAIANNAAAIDPGA